MVELDGAAACARCARGRGCGAAVFAPAGRPLRLDCALEPAGSAVAATAVRVGTRVEVDLHDTGSRWLVPVVLAYGLPTLGLLAGALVPEPWTPLTAVAGLVGGLLAWRACNAGWADGRSTGSSPADREGPCRPVARIARQCDHRPSEGEQTA